MIGLRHFTMPVAKWLRKVLKPAARSNKDLDQKICAIREAANYSFPVGDMDEMLADIERGYSGGSRK
jgi:hypothetical protein